MKREDEELKQLSLRLMDLLHYFTHEASMDTAVERMLEVGSVNLRITELLD